MLTKMVFNVSFGWKLFNKLIFGYRYRVSGIERKGKRKKRAKVR